MEGVFHVTSCDGGCVSRHVMWWRVCFTSRHVMEGVFHVLFNQLHISTLCVLLKGSRV